MNKPTCHEPEGWSFYDKASKRKMKLVTAGPWSGWIVYQHPDGQWVSLRKATEEDVIAMAKAASASIHGRSLV